MEQPFIERRRAPRTSTETAALSAVHVSVPVRLLDIGSEGLLMACWTPLRVGSTVRVVAGFAGRRLEVELSVRHTSGRWDGRVGGYVVGGSFASFDAAARQTITALLSARGLGAAGEPDPLVAHGRSEAPVRAGVRRERRASRLDQPRPDQSSWSSPAA